MSKKKRELTRAELAKALGRNKSFVIREEKAGRIKPTRIGKRNARLYDEDYVRTLTGASGRIERLPKAQAYVPDAAGSIMSVSPKVASQAITRLAAGATRLEVLAEFELYPQQVEELDAARMRLCGGLSLSAEHLDEIAVLLQHTSPLGDPDIFLALIRFVADTLECVQCRSGQATYCEECAARYAQNAIAMTNEKRQYTRNGGEHPGQYGGASRARQPHVPASPYRSRHERAGDGDLSANAVVTTRSTSKDSRSDHAPSLSAANPQPGRTKRRRPERPVAATSSADLGSFHASDRNGPSQYAQQERAIDDTTLNAGSGGGALVGTEQEVSINDQASAIPLDRSDPAFWDNELLVLKHEHDVLSRLLANSPLRGGAGIAFKKEPDDGKKGDGGPSG
jgi:hypothetical protein